MARCYKRGRKKLNYRSRRRLNKVVRRKCDKNLTPPPPPPPPLKAPRCTSRNERENIGVDTLELISMLVRSFCQFYPKMFLKHFSLVS